MPNEPIPAAAEGMSDLINRHASIVDLARRLGAVYLLEEALEVRTFNIQDGQVAKRGSLQRGIDHLGDEAYILRDMISVQPATSLEDAAIQVAEAVNVLDIIHDQFPEDHESYQIKRDFRALARLLHSVFTLINSKAADKVENIVTPSYGAPYTSPWSSMNGADLVAEED